jgi:hypothetical protein
MKLEFVYASPAPVGVFSIHPEDLAMPDSEDSVNLDEVSANLEKLIGLLEEIDLIQATASKQLEEADDLEEMDLIGATALNRLEDIRLQCQAAQRVGRGCRSL